MSGEDTTVQGGVSVTTSVGTKKESEANIAGTQADPAFLERERPLPKRTFEGQNYSKVSLQIGVTRSLGNFEFARIDVSAEDFCAPEDKEKTWNALNDLASGYVLRESAKIKDYMKSKDAAKAAR